MESYGTSSKTSNSTIKISITKGNHLSNKKVKTLSKSNKSEYSLDHHLPAGLEMMQKH